jgi:lysophospholipase L1-like esterase
MMKQSFRSVLRGICIMMILPIMGMVGASCASSPKPTGSEEMSGSSDSSSLLSDDSVSDSSLLMSSVLTSAVLISSMPDSSVPPSSALVSSPASSVTSSAVPISSSLSSTNPSSFLSSSESSSEESSLTENVRLDAYEKFLQKAQRGETIYVAFLGGSITAGASYANWGQPNPYIGTNLDGTPIDTTEYWSYPSSDDLRGSWRYRVFDWLSSNHQVQENQFVQINAAIGGTNSEFGALRLEDHVFARGIPDLIFIEYAVNDNGRGAYDIRSSYESIVNRLRDRNPDCAIFIALSPSRQKKDAANPGFYDVVRGICDITKDYADYKKIPYAVIEDAFYHSGLTEAQKTALYYGPQSDFGSQVHPSPYGYEIYANEVNRVLQSCFSTLEFSFNKTDIVLPPPYPATSRIWFGEDLISLMPGSVAVDAVNDPRSNKCISYHKILKTSSLDDELRFEFEGTGAWLWLDLSYTNYRIDVYLNGTRILTDWAIEGSQVKLLSKFLSDDTVHELRIVPKSASDSTKPFSFGLRGIIVSE